MSSGVGTGKREVRSLGARSSYLCERAVTVVSIRSDGRKQEKDSSAADRKIRRKKITFQKFLTDRFGDFGRGY